MTLSAFFAIGLPAASPLLAALVALAYALGSLPFGLWIGQLRGVDLRTVGSGNIGATNAARAMGKRLATLVLALDALKGFVPVWLAHLLMAGMPGRDVVVAATMVAAVLGHTHSFLLRFRGGKGVATGLGVTLAAAPLAALTGVLAYATALALTRISSIGSLTGLGAALLACWLGGVPRPTTAALGIIAVLVLWRHKDNLRRLRQGKER